MASRVHMNERLRHKTVYGFFRFLLKGVMSRILGYTYEVADVGCYPYLVVANHNTDFDPILIGFAFPKHMYYVASEHIFRKGFASWLLRRYLAPISRMKGSTDASTAINVLRTIKKGFSVCLFAEGDRSFSGVTGPVVQATGKLARASGVPLVTFKFTGGYLTTPRWGQTRRKGRMRGQVVNTYSAAELRAMQPEEINARIRADLYEDAFERQEKERTAFTGKRLAERLEYALFACPKCGRIGELHSEDDRFFCGCGLSVRFTQYGFFEGDGGQTPPFTTVRDWDRWQIGLLGERLAALGDAPAFSDENQPLYLVGQDHAVTAVATGTLQMTARTLSVGDTSFAVAAIDHMAMYASTNLIFSTDGRHYEVRSTPTCCRRKYFLLYQLIKKRQGTE